MMVKKVRANHDSSKSSGPDYILVMVLMKCEPELPYTLAELFNMYLKEFYFPDYWKAFSVFPAFKNGVYMVYC